MKYIKAVAAIIGIVCVDVALELLAFGYDTRGTFGWGVRQAMYFFAMVAAWRVIVKRKPSGAQTAPATSPVEFGNKINEVQKPVTDKVTQTSAVTSQARQTEYLKPAIKPVNICSACDANNPPDVSFCESCGGAFYRNCPECERKTRINQKYCGGCGTDMDGFLTATEHLRRMDKCYSSGYLDLKKLIQIVGESEKLDDNIRLPGKKGAQLRWRITQCIAQAEVAINKGERLEKEILHLAGGDSKNWGINGAAISTSDSKKLLRLLYKLYLLKSLSAEFQTLKKYVESRIEAAARIKKRKAIIIGVFVLVALVALLRNWSSLMLPYHTKTFRNAIETRQVEDARVIAKILGDQYDTANELNALEMYVTAKKQLLDMTDKIDQVKKIHYGEWASIQQLIEIAESTKDPREGIRLYAQAQAKLKVAIQQINDLISAKQSCKNSFEKKSVTDSDLLKYATQEWKAAKQALETAESSTAPTQATAAYRQAETLIRAAIEKVRTVPAEITIECKATNFQVLENNQQLTVSNGQLCVPPFTEHTFEIRAKGYKPQTRTILASEPGQKLSLNVALDKIPPAGGDPKAADWEQVNDRWVKNIYADHSITMSDKASGRMWPYDLSPYSFREQSWVDAVTYCNNFIYAGYSDWRLPDKDTLCAQASQRHLFKNVKSGHYYWSGTSFANSTDYAWFVDMDYYGVNFDNKTKFYYVWPVRGGN